MDIQNDFVQGGALPVPNGKDVVPIANRLIAHFQSTDDLIVATQDWHPPNHSSFVSQHQGRHVGDIIRINGLRQELWPDHCVRNTHGAEFVSELNRTAIQSVVRKGSDPSIDSYSGFFDNDRRKPTLLDEILRRSGVDSIYLLGLTTDYCVKFTALDSRQLGFETCLIREGTRAINIRAGDEERSIAEMRSAGVHVATVEDIVTGAS